MKRYIIFIVLMALLVCFSEAALAQIPFWFGLPNPFFFPMIPTGSFAPSFPMFPMFPPLPPIGPFPSPFLAPRTLLSSLLSPIRMPRPLLRQAAATITIFFNPTLSIIQVTVLPLSPLAAPVPVPIPAPVTALAPSLIAPAIGPTALALLPLLTGLTAATQTKTLTRLITTAAPVLPALTGIAAFLPFIYKLRIHLGTSWYGLQVCVV